MPGIFPNVSNGKRLHFWNAVQYVRLFGWMSYLSFARQDITLPFKVWLLKRRERNL
jgi:hypothetical protein